MNIRVIPRLDIKGPNLVKGIHFEGLRVLGKPERFARRYYEDGADELIYMDAVASLYGRNSLTEIIERTAREIFIPLAVGGGLRSIEDIRTVLRSGADKVCINTAAVNDPELITAASRAFGSSTVLISVEAVRRSDGGWEAMTDYGRESTGLDAVEWAKKAVSLGAGEIMVTSIDMEGTGKGFDLDLVKSVSEAVGVPVIASGGAGSAQDMAEAVESGRADAVCAASIFHYECAARLSAEDQNYEEEGNISFLKSGKAFSKVSPAGIKDVKAAMLKRDLDVREVA